jgi:hypothetical protein
MNVIVGAASLPDISLRPNHLDRRIDATAGLGGGLRSLLPVQGTI